MKNGKMFYNADMENKAKTKRRPKKIITKLISIVVVCVAIYLFIGVGKELYTTLSLKKQAEEVAEQLAILEAENATLIQRRDKLEDPNYVETYARGEYMFSKDDEKIFYLPGNTASPDSTDNSQE